MTEDRFIDKALKKSIFPMVVAGLIGTLAMLIDSMFIGKFLDTTQMAAYGLCSPVLLIVTMIGGVLSFGTSILISEAYATGDRNKASRAFSRTVIVSVVLFLMILFFIVFFGEKLAGILSGKNIEEVTKRYMLDYLYGFAPSFLVLLILELFIHITNLEGKKEIVYVCVFTTLIVDVVLDAVNVFVWHKGLLGMGLASSISYFAAFIIYILFIVFKSNISLLFRNLNWKSYPDTLKKGLPVGINRLVTALRMIFLNKILIMTASENAVAALSVNNSVMQIILAICNGVGGACTLIASFLAVDKDIKGLRTLFKKSIRYAFFGAAAAALLCIAFSTPVTLLFTSGKAQIVSEASVSIIFGAIYVPIYTVTYQVYSYLHGMDRKSLSIPLVVIQNGTIAVIVAYFLGRKFGSIGVWAALPISAFIVLLIFTIVYLLMAKKEGVNPTQYAFISPVLYPDENTVYEFDIETFEDFAGKSELLKAFSCNLTNRNIAEAVCCCVSETVKSIYHSECNKYTDLTVNIRATAEKNGITVRIRDNRNPLGLAECECENGNPEFPRIIPDMPQGVHKEIKYSKIVNINNRIIRIYGE